jgi:hypothetical protein
MFLREKTINGYTYLYLVESLREGVRTRQRIIKNLGRKDAALASGELDRLAASVARFAERALVLAQVESGNPDGLTCRRIGPPLLFGRLWQDAGIQAVLKELLGGRAFEFQVERAVFAATLHRLMAPRLRPGLREVDGRLRHPGQRRPCSAPLLPRHGLAGRGTARG